VESYVISSEIFDFIKDDANKSKQLRK
jgi:hypothetical protein